MHFPFMLITVPLFLMHSTTNWLSGGPFIKYRCGHLWTAQVLAFTIVARPVKTVGISLFYNFDLKHIQTLKISLNKLMCILFCIQFWLHSHHYNVGPTDKL